MVAGRILERAPEEGLTTSADQHQMGHLAPEELALNGGEISGGRGQQCAHPLHALEIARETVGHRHRHRAEQTHDLQVAIVEKIPARCPVHGFEYPFVRVPPALRGEGGDTEEDAHELAALAQLVVHIAPFLALIAQLRQEARRF